MRNRNINFMTDTAKDLPSKEVTVILFMVIES